MTATRTIRETRQPDGSLRGACMEPDTGDMIPTTEQIRQAYAWWDEGIDFKRVEAEQRAAFDRWLAAHDAKVRREAKAEALREAAEDVAYEVRRFEVGCEADAGYYDAHMEISKMFRDRAARAEGER